MDDTTFGVISQGVNMNAELWVELLVVLFRILAAGTVG
jgi:hypothetical protein